MYYFYKEVNMKRNIIIGLFLSIFLLIGCARQPQESNTITVWHWMTDRDKSFQELALKYEEATGVKVVFELYAPSDVYSQKIIASAQARVLPDIFGILDKKKVVAVIKWVDGTVLDSVYKVVSP